MQHRVYNLERISNKTPMLTTMTHVSRAVLTAALMVILPVAFPGCSKNTETPNSGAAIDKNDNLSVLADPHAMFDTKNSNVFVHPNTGGKLKVITPEAVKSGWKAVKLAVAAGNTQEQHLRAVIGGKQVIDNLGLTLHVVTYLPSFKTVNQTITSESNRPDNPAVLLQVRDAQGASMEGWIFQNLPEFNTFRSGKMQIRLVSAESTEK